MKWFNMTCDFLSSNEYSCFEDQKSVENNLKKHLVDIFVYWQSLAFKFSCSEAHLELSSDVGMNFLTVTELPDWVFGTLNFVLEDHFMCFFIL